MVYISREKEGSVPYREEKGSIRQGKRLIAADIDVQLREEGKVWSGIFPGLARGIFVDSDPNFFFTLILADGREGDIYLTYRRSRLIPFEIAFEGVARKRME